MAGLRRGGGRRGAGTRPRHGLSLSVERRERAQLILIAGFVIAVSIVGLALIVNTAIFTENLATRSDASGAVDALSYRSSADANLDTVLIRVNDAEADATYATLESSLDGSVDEYGTLSGRQQSLSGQVTDLTLASTTDGVRIYQNDSSAFENDAGDENWTLATDVDDTRQFRINVTSDTDIGDRRDFRMNASQVGGSDVWAMNVSRDASNNIVARINANGEISTCGSGLSPPFWINVTSGTVGGEACDAMNFSEWSGDHTYDLAFENTSKIRGNYTLTTDVARSSLPSVGSAYGGDDGSPTADRVLYASRTTLVYRTSKLEYETRIRTAPGESGE